MLVGALNTYEKIILDSHDTNKIMSREAIRSTGVYGKNLNIDRKNAEQKKKRSTWSTILYIVILFKKLSTTLSICFFRWLFCIFRKALCHSTYAIFINRISLKTWKFIYKINTVSTHCICSSSVSICLKNIWSNNC